MDNPELEGLVLSLWRRRNEANAIRDITASLAKLIKDPAALDAVEFYLPQFAHMIIQLGDALPEVSELEKFLLSVCQMSVHLALQFFWIVYASLQEHRPKKPGSNRSIYTRCAKLLLRLEQCVTYGLTANIEQSTDQAALIEECTKMAVESMATGTTTVSDDAPPIASWTCGRTGARREGW